MSDELLKMAGQVCELEDLVCELLAIMRSPDAGGEEGVKRGCILSHARRVEERAQDRKKRWGVR